MRRGLCAAALLLAWLPAGADGQAPPARTRLNCDYGPVPKTYGNSDWQVYACDDRRTLIVVAAPGSLAEPFLFRFTPQPDGYLLTGEGSGNRLAAHDAYKELRALSAADILQLLREARGR